MVLFFHNELKTVMSEKINCCQNYKIYIVDGPFPPELELNLLSGRGHDSCF